MEETKKPEGIKKLPVSEEQEKQTAQKQTPLHPPAEINNAEFVQIGEIKMQSEMLRADVLLGFIIGALKNKDIKKYLGLIEKKKSGGGYLG